MKKLTIIYPIPLIKEDEKDNDINWIMYPENYKNCQEQIDYIKELAKQGKDELTIVSFSPYIVEASLKYLTNKDTELIFTDNNTIFEDANGIFSLMAKPMRIMTMESINS